MERKLKSLRRRTLINRTISWFSRSLLITSIAVFVLFVGSKILSFNLPLTLLGLFSIPFLLSFYPLVKGCSMRECAISLDAKLSLDDRITTALETPPVHPMYQALLKDVESALRHRDISSAYTILIPKQLPISLLLSCFIFLIISTPVTVFGNFDNDSVYFKDKKNEAINFFKLALLRAENAEQKKLLEQWLEKFQDAKLPGEILDLIKKFLNDREISSINPSNSNNTIPDLKEGLEGLGAQIVSKLGASAKLHLLPPENISSIPKELIKDKSSHSSDSSNPPILESDKSELTQAELISGVNSQLFSIQGSFIPMEYKGIFLKYKKFLTEHNK